MTDKELLMLAMKAVGGLVKPDQEASWDSDPGAWISGNGVGYFWNPLTDDAQALQLAVNLCMTIGTGPVMATANTAATALCGVFPQESTLDQGHVAAVRRVIVRAAAEHAKVMS